MSLTDEQVQEIIVERMEPNPVSGCWEWQRMKNKKGYGRVRVTKYKGMYRFSWRAHRLSYTAFIGDIPDELFVCHKCDNPSCVNPDHLFIGDHNDNMRDMVEKGRANCHRSYGNNFSSKSVIADGETFKSYSAAARALGVSDTTIRNRIKNSWEGYQVL